MRHFERARPNQLWQTDLFTFVLKRQNRRVYLVAFMDDHSRFIVGYGLHASQSTALVLEVWRAAIASYGAPEEVLTDNGSQYITWRGKGAFTKELEKRGVRQVVASPRHPQTLGKIERFWGTLWRECVESAVFIDLGDARQRIGLFIDHYNFQRPHQGIGGLVPADRFFGAAPDVLRTLQARVAANALDLARQGVPKAPFYLTGQVGGQPFSLHAEGDRVILTGAAGSRREVDLVPPAAPPPPTAEAAGLPQPVCPQGLVPPIRRTTWSRPPPERRRWTRGCGRREWRRAAARGRRPAMRTSPTHTGRVVGTRPDVQSAPAVQPAAGDPAPEAGQEARRLAAAILEVLAGLQTPSVAARGLGLSLARYYQLEVRALAGLVSACESRRRGRQSGNELAGVARECERLRPGVRPSTSGGPGHAADGRADGTAPGRTPAGGGATPAPADRPRLKGGGAAPGRHRRGGAPGLPCGRGGTVTFRVAKERRG